MRQMQLKALGIQQRTKQINTLGAVGWHLSGGQQDHFCSHRHFSAGEVVMCDAERGSEGGARLRGGDGGSAGRGLVDKGDPLKGLSVAD